MAERSFRSARTMNYQKDCVRVTGSFIVDATPATGVVHGDGFAVARTGAGDYLVTLTDQFRHIIAFGTDLGLAAPLADFIINAGIPVVAVGAAATMQIQTFDTATLTAADPAAITDRISFWMILSNSYQDT